MWGGGGNLAAQKHLFHNKHRITQFEPELSEKQTLNRHRDRETFQTERRSAIGGVIIGVFETTTPKETGESFLGYLHNNRFLVETSLETFAVTLPLQKPKQQHFPSSFVTRTSFECLLRLDTEEAFITDQTDRVYESKTSANLKPTTVRVWHKRELSVLRRSRTSEFRRVLETHSDSVSQKAKLPTVNCANKLE